MPSDQIAHSFRIASMPTHIFRILFSTLLTLLFMVTLPAAAKKKPSHAEQCLLAMAEPDAIATRAQRDRLAQRHSGGQDFEGIQVGIQVLVGFMDPGEAQREISARFDDEAEEAVQASKPTQPEQTNIPFERYNDEDENNDLPF